MYRVHRVFNNKRTINTETYRVNRVYCTCRHIKICVKYKYIFTYYIRMVYVCDI